MKKSLAALAVLLIVLMVGGIVVAVYDPSLLNQFTGKQDTTLSINSINVEPQDSAHLVGNEYYGSFWDIVTYVNANDDLAGVILPKGQTGSVTYQGAVTALQTGAKIEIKIDPQQPYLLHDLQEKVPVAAPSAIGPSGSTASQFNLDYYDWSGTWQIYTPFLVSIYKDGVLIGSETINEQGSNQIQTISTSEGPITIQNLGTLGNNYLKPDMPSQIAIFKGGPYVYDWTQIQSLLSGASSTYSNYWYGSNRDSQNRAIFPGGSPSLLAGWEAQSGDTFNTKVKPIAPVTYSGDKSNLPSDKKTFLSVTEWLQSRGIQNLASTIFDSQATGDSGAMWQKISMVTDSNNQQIAIRLDVPWGAFGTPEVNIRIPTELADTFVERTIVTNTQVSATWESTGTKYCDVYGANRIAVVLTNTASVTGSTYLTASSANGKLDVTPLQMTVNNLAQNVPQTVYFDVTNLGVLTETDNIPITITASNTVSGTPTGSDIVYGTLKPTLTTGTTTLLLNVVEKDTNTLIPSLQLSVQYGNQAPTEFTDANGQVTMTLTTPQGGAYTGQVTVTSADTAVYNSTQATYTLNSATAYTFTLEVPRKDTNYGGGASFNWILVLELIGIVAAIAVLAGAGFAVHKKMKHHVKRRR